MRSVTAPATISAGLIGILPQTPDVQTIRLQRPFDFKAGQSVRVVLPGDPKKRFYSISSSPTEKSHLDITIKSERGTLLYQSLFQLKPGMPIEVAGPMGKFSLPDGNGPFYFLAGGTGVAPFRSMIKWLLDTQPSVEHWLFHSVRTPDDLIFQDEFLKWDQGRSFHYRPTFTRFSQRDPQKETGRIGELLLRKHLPEMPGIFLLCGPTELVGDLEHLLQESLHIPSSRIRREQW